jgi:hypothetical protein
VVGRESPRAQIGIPKELKTLALFQSIDMGSRGLSPHRSMASFGRRTFSQYLADPKTGLPPKPDRASHGSLHPPLTLQDSAYQ